MRALGRSSRSRRSLAAYAAAALVVLATSCTAPSAGPAPPVVPRGAPLEPTADCRRAGSTPVPAALGRAAVRDRGGWRLAFRDEFDGTSLDTDVWDYRQEGLRVAAHGRGHAASSRSAVSVRGGELRLRATADPARPGSYLNGHVSTEQTYTFRGGIAAARVRFQRARGQHGAFWIQSPTEPRKGAGPATNGAEIDVAEFFGEGYPHGGLSHFVHYLADDGTWAKSGGLLSRRALRLPRGRSWWNSFHVFSVEWSPDRPDPGYVFRIDGRVTWCSSQGVSGVPQFLVLSLLNSDWELARLRPARLPQTMTVDWVRVWQR